MRKNPYKPEEPKSWKIWRGYKTDVIFCIMIIFVSKFPKTNSSLIHGESWEFTEILNSNIACTRWLILMWIRRYSCLFIKKSLAWFLSDRWVTGEIVTLIADMEYLSSRQVLLFLNIWIHFSSLSFLKVFFFLDW